MTAWSNELQSLDPETDYERIVYLLSVYEFSWDIEKALEFALFRTYAVPSISSLLSRTGAFSKDTRKAIERMNDMHGRYRISNNDMLYVLSTFVVEPVKWLERFGKRAMRPAEIEASVLYYQALGQKMGIKDIPLDFVEFEEYQRAYEATHFHYEDTNAEIGCLTRDLLLSMYLPNWLVPFGRPAVHALCDPELRDAMGFTHPPRRLEHAMVTGLKLRASLLRILPSRRRPRLLTKRDRPTYPSGYRIGELGTFK